MVKEEDLKERAKRLANKITFAEKEKLDKCQGKCKLRNANIEDDIFQMLAHICYAFDKTNLQTLEGCTCEVSQCVSSDFSRAYFKKGSPKGTVNEYFIKNNRFVLINSTRDYRKNHIRFCLTDSASRIILDKLCVS